MKGPLDVTLTKVTPRRQGCPRGYYDDDDVYDGEIGVVQIGRSQAVIETTLSHSDDVTGAWLREATTLARGRRLRAPSVAGLLVLRGREPPAAQDSSRTARRASDSDRDHATTNQRVRGVALCLGGSRVLVYRPDEFGRCHTAGDGRRLRFVEDGGNNNMRQLRAFLGDKRVTVACVGGGREAAVRLAEEWGLHVARPAELTDLFLRAFGKAADDAEEESDDAPWIMPDEAHKHRIRRRPSLFAGTTTMKRARAMADVQEDPAKRRAAARRVLTMERMARAAIGPEMRLERPPAKAAEADWGGPELGETEWQQATRDAYLCFEVAVRCLQKLGTPIGT